jgi:hypothetical protein
MIGAWCAIIAIQIGGSTIFGETIYSKQYVNHILQPYFDSIIEEEKDTVILYKMVLQHRYWKTDR